MKYCKRFCSSGINYDKLFVLSRLRHLTGAWPQWPRGQQISRIRPMGPLWDMRTLTFSTPEPGTWLGSQLLINEYFINWWPYLGQMWSKWFHRPFWAIRINLKCVSPSGLHLLDHQTPPVWGFTSKFSTDIDKPMNADTNDYFRKPVNAADNDDEDGNQPTVSEYIFHLFFDPKHLSSFVTDGQFWKSISQFHHF